MAENKRKKFGKKALVEWVFPWGPEGRVKRKIGDLVKIGEELFTDGEVFLSPVDGKVLKVNKKERELVLVFKAFEFFGKTEGEDRLWAEIIIEEDGELGVEEMEDRVVVFSENSPILVAKSFALGAKGVIIFEEGEMSFSNPFLKLSEEEKEKFLSVLRLMERPVVHLDCKTGRLLLTENKKTK